MGNIMLRWYYELVSQEYIVMIWLFYELVALEYIVVKGLYIIVGKLYILLHFIGEDYI